MSVIVAVLYGIACILIGFRLGFSAGFTEAALYVLEQREGEDR